MLTVVQKLRRLRECVAGNVAMEFAIGGPLLVLFLAGVWDLGRAINDNSMLLAAANAGAQYGSQSGKNSLDINGMVAAAQSIAPGGYNNITANRFCECIGGGSVSCAGTCGGTEPIVFVEVQVERTFSSLFPVLPDNFALSQEVSMRAQYK